MLILHAMLIGFMLDLLFGPSLVRELGSYMPWGN